MRQLKIPALLALAAAGAGATPLRAQIDGGWGGGSGTAAGHYATVNGIRLYYEDRGTGRPLHAFARAVLFDPLGIGESVWAAGSDGIASAASGLRLVPRDLARIGQMIVQRGQWQGREVVPGAWLDAAFTKPARGELQIGGFANALAALEGDEDAPGLRCICTRHHFVPVAGYLRVAGFF